MAGLGHCGRSAHTVPADLRRHFGDCIFSTDLVPTIRLPAFPSPTSCHLRPTFRMRIPANENIRFGAAIGLRSLLEDFAPTIPDYANDQHALAGRKLGRGLDHFRHEHHGADRRRRAVSVTITTGGDRAGGIALRDLCLSFFSRWAIRDRRCLFQGRERVLHG